MRNTCGAKLWLGCLGCVEADSAPLRTGPAIMVLARGRLHIYSGKAFNLYGTCGHMFFYDADKEGVVSKRRHYPLERCTPTLAWRVFLGGLESLARSRRSREAVSFREQDTSLAPRRVLQTTNRGDCVVASGVGLTALDRLIRQRSRPRRPENRTAIHKGWGESSTLG